MSRNPAHDRYPLFVAALEAAARGDRPPLALEETRRVCFRDHLIQGRAEKIGNALHRGLDR